VISIEQLVAGHPLLAGLPGETVAHVAGCARNVAFEAGELLVREGEDADTFFLVRRGHISIDVHAPGRGPIVIESVGPGAVVGWSWMVPPYRWTFDARAIDRVGAIAVDGACLRLKAFADPAFGFELLSRISVQLLDRLQSTRLRLLDLYGDDRVR
jgi:CRP-like cAMP-binding protein